MNAVPGILALTLVSLFSSAVQSSEASQGYSEVLRLIDNNQSKQARDLASRLKEPWITFLRIHVELRRTNSNKALAMLDDMLADPSTGQWPSDVLTCLADLLCAANRLETAENTRKLAFAKGADLERVDVALAAANSHFNQRSYDKALSWADLASKALRMSPSFASDADQWSRVNAIRGQCVIAVETAKHGYGYILLKAARELTKSGQYKSALDRVDELLKLADRNRKNSELIGSRLMGLSNDDMTLKNTPIELAYEESARFLKCRLLFVLGRHREGHVSLESFIADFPTSPYLGEIALILGDSALFSAKPDVNIAHRHYTRSIEWLTDDRAAEAAGFAFLVPPDATGPTSPPQFITRTDSWGNAFWSRPDPSELFNAATCPWYRQYVLISAYSKRALCNHLAGRPAEALIDLEMMMKLDPASRRPSSLTGVHFSRYRRLKDDFRAGRMFATISEAQEFPAAARVSLALADLNLELEMWDEAITSYDRLLLDPARPLSPKARNYLIFAKAFCELHLGNRLQSERLLDQVLAGNEHAGSITWTRAMIIKSDLQMEGAQKMDLLKQALAKSPVEMRLEIAFRIGQQLFCLGNFPEARKYLDVVVDKASHTQHIYQGSIDLLAFMASNNPIHSPE